MFSLRPKAFSAAATLPLALTYRWDASTAVTRSPAERSHALTDETAAAVGSYFARYCAGVRKWWYVALPGVATAATAVRRAARPPRGARYTRRLTRPDAFAGRTAACAVHAGALPRSATAWLLAPVAVATPPAATTAARPHEATAPRTNKRLPTRSPTPETLTLLAGAGRLLYPRARHPSLDAGYRAE